MVLGILNDMRYQVTIIILLVLTLGLIVFEPSWGWGLQRFFAGDNAKSALAPAQALMVENESLKSEVALLAGVKDQLAISKLNTINVPVYAHYPFNFKNELLLAAGAKNGIAVGQPVLAAESLSATDQSRGVLLGTVIRVFPESALVRTVFDAHFQASVRIGKEGMRALFAGGLEPKVTLIPKNAKIMPGDSILSVDPGFPYGVSVGSLKEVRLATDHASQEATAVLPYEVADIRLVRIIINHDTERLLEP